MSKADQIICSDGMCEQGSLATMKSTCTCTCNTRKAIDGSNEAMGHVGIH
jgi:hypothetical protein